jgi:hypothetical protein
LSAGTDGGGGEAAALGAALAAVAAELAAPVVDAAGAQVAGRLRERAVSVRFGQHAEARTAAAGGARTTVVEVESRTPPLLLEVRPETSDERALVDGGLAVDVAVGDHLFDAAFVVDAQPPGLAQHLLDGRTRARLWALRPATLTHLEAVLRLEAPGWPADAAHAKELLDLCVATAERLPVALDLAARAAPDAGSPYRSAALVAEIPDDAPPPRAAPPPEPAAAADFATAFAADQRAYYGRGGGDVADADAEAHRRAGDPDANAEAHRRAGDSDDGAAGAGGEAGDGAGGGDGDGPYEAEDRARARERRANVIADLKVGAGLLGLIVFTLLMAALSLGHC